MQLLIYVLLYPFLWLISKLPFRLIYILSDIVYALVYNIFAYRKKVVIKNLELAFPDKSKSEHELIAKKFYKHLCDVIFESIKSISITEKELHKRFIIEDTSLFNELEKNNKSAILMLAHYGNWEWIFILQTIINHKGYGVYKRLKNKYFDRLVKSIRAKYNTQLITTKETINTLNKVNDKGELSLSGFISDQSPKKDKAFHWQKFMGIEVPVYTGAEMLAKKLDHAVVFCKISKLCRGHYSCSFQLITKQPKTVPDYQITDQFLELVEQQIYEEPAYYLWTHKRWKHRKQ
ncbi:lysophospholipid acyltransferase family protein [Psychroflexus sp. ALD_RP9]|uniref:lysophospholipid acyltransferase family protein n=1 Tax=Psychroflexus sp. ALD_RP9 TaxID=2777186 RepID=UPI001A8FB7DA|nr:lysophospholipid acyltransferase family protein [Psychroflexus sp. ALD_RP9]QSS97120.1 lysophospholipid acyltransferase family protein [Psychroflexus sp. ALD_RP9]